MIRILVVNKIYPSRGSAVQAANTVTFELIATLARQPNTKVGFLKISIGDEDSALNIDESNKELLNINVEVLEPLKIRMNGRKSKFNNIRSLFFPKDEDFYPIVLYKERANQIIEDWKADAIIIPWCELSTALCADANVRVKYAYYGNPDSKPALARLQFHRRFVKDAKFLEKIKYFFRKIRCKNLEKIHVSILNKYDFIGDVALNDVLFYRNKGLDNAFYVRNMWYDRFGESVWQIKEEKESAENIIIGNVGKLDATANTFGLEILGREIVPLLQEKLGKNKFKINILGAREPVSYIKNLLTRYEEITFSGFVDDIDTEIQKAKVFLVTNNGSSYKVGHTRYLHAWSLGTCVVAHADVTLSMPEIINGYNALLGKDSEEIVDLIIKALDNKEVRFMIARNGYKTFRQFYIADVIVPEILNDINQIWRRKTSLCQIT